MGLHKDYTGDELHVPGRVASSDPGAVGAGHLWFDSTDGTGKWLMKTRNVADTGWEETGREATPVIPHWSKGTGELGLITVPLKIYVTGAEDAWEIDVSVFDFAIALQGGAATPDLIFDINTSANFPNNPSTDPHAATLTIDPNTIGTQFIYIQVLDDTTFAQIESHTYIVSDGLTSGGGP